METRTHRAEKQPTHPTGTQSSGFSPRRHRRSAGKSSCYSRILIANIAACAVFINQKEVLFNSLMNNQIILM